MKTLMKWAVAIGGVFLVWRELPSFRRYMRMHRM